MRSAEQQQQLYYNNNNFTTTTTTTLLQQQQQLYYNIVDTNKNVYNNGTESRVRCIGVCVAAVAIIIAARPIYNIKKSSLLVIRNPFFAVFNYYSCYCSCRLCCCYTHWHTWRVAQQQKQCRQQQRQQLQRYNIGNNANINFIQQLEQWYKSVTINAEMHAITTNLNVYTKSATTTQAKYTKATTTGTTMQQWQQQRLLYNSDNKSFDVEVLV